MKTPLSWLMSNPVKRAHDMMTEHGLSPMKNKKISKCLTLAKILINDAPTTSTSSTKQRISSVKRRKQQVRYFLVRSDNAIYLPGKKECVKIRKEKKQVYVLKEYLCNL